MNKIEKKLVRLYYQPIKSSSKFALIQIKSEFFHVERKHKNKINWYDNNMPAA